MHDPPELVLEKILSYLSLVDRLRSRAVSKRWCQMIDSLKVKTLCYSDRPIGFLFGKSRFVPTFISSPGFESFFFNAFCRSIRCHLKRLHLCVLNAYGKETAFAQFLNSFDQLEELNIIRFANILELNLPMLQSIQLGEKAAIGKLTLDTPRLKKVHLLRYFNLNLVHESVEMLYINMLEDITELRSGEPLELAKRLGKLKYCYVKSSLFSNYHFLFRLKQLQEVHVYQRICAHALITGKRQYGRDHLMIYLCGLLLNDLDDPLFDYKRLPHPGGFMGNTLAFLAENLPILADNPFPFCRQLYYSAIELVPARLKTSLLKRFVDFDTLKVDIPVKQIQHFLDFLTSFKHIAALCFSGSDQAQDLFNRLPDHCAVQQLAIYQAVPDFEFLFRLKHLIHLKVGTSSFGIELIRRAFEELKFLSYFQLVYKERIIEICIEANIDNQKQFAVKFRNRFPRNFTELNDAIKFIAEN